jgi:hypothetical protein
MKKCIFFRLTNHYLYLPSLQNHETFLPPNFYEKTKQELKPKPNRDSTPSPPPLQSDSREKVNKKTLADFSPVEQI